MTTFKANVPVLPKHILCPSCHREMNLGNVGNSAICIYKECALYEKRFVVDLPTFEITLRLLDGL